MASTQVLDGQSGSPLRHRLYGVIAALVVLAASVALAARASAPLALNPPGTTPLGITAFAGIIIDPADGRVYVSGSDKVVALTPEGTVLGSLTLPGAAGLAIEGDDLWVTGVNAGKVYRVDLATWTLAESFTIGTTVSDSVVVTGGYVWFPGSFDSNYADLLRLDPATGAVHNMGAAVYGGRVSEIPGSTTELLFHDRGLSPFSVYRTSITGDLAVKGPDVDHGVGSNLREVVATEKGTFVTASGAPYQFPEFRLSDMASTGVVYSGSNYPSGVAYTPAGGGVFVGSTQSTNRLFVHRTGFPTAAYEINAGRELAYSAVEIAPDASAVYAVAVGTTYDLLRFDIAPTIASVNPPAAQVGTTPTVTLMGDGLQYTYEVLVDGVPVPFSAAGNVVFDLPSGLPVGSAVIEVRTTFGPALSAIDITLDPPTTSTSTTTTSTTTTSSTSTTTTSTTTTSSTSTTTTTIPIDAPPKPEQPDETPGHLRVTVRWKPVASPVSFYEVKLLPGASWCLTTDLECTFTSLPTGVPVTAVVRAVNSAGPGPWSDPSDAVTPYGCDGASPFSDVAADSQFCGYIAWLVTEDIASGYPGGAFGPRDPVTRQTIAAVLHRFEGTPAFPLPLTPSFTDVPEGHLFATPIEWAAWSQTAGGYPDGTYRPTRPVSRQALAALLFRLAGSPSVFIPTLPTFSDVPADHPYFEEIEWAASVGIIGGFADGSFKPGAAITRQALAKMLWSFAALPV